MKTFLVISYLIQAFSISAEMLPDRETQELFKIRRQKFVENDRKSSHLLHSGGISVQASIYQIADNGRLTFKVLVLAKNDSEKSIRVCGGAGGGDDLNALEPSLKTSDGLNVSLNEKGRAHKSSKNTFSKLIFFELKPGATRSYVLDLNYYFELQNVLEKDVTLSGMVYYSPAFSTVYSDKMPVLAVPFTVEFGPGAKRDSETASVAPARSSMEHIRSPNPPQNAH